MSKVAVKTNPLLWKKIVSQVKSSNKGGKPGQWSARKAQIAVKSYKKRGGRYSGKRSKSNSLHRWTKQKWRTRSGKPSIMGPKATGERYLPVKVIRKTSRKDYDRSSRLKRRSIKRGKQYSRQTSKLRKRLSRYLRKH
jgi:hypothetical protein